MITPPRWLTLPAGALLLAMIAILNRGNAAAIPPTGYIDTIAGTGALGDAGDGGPATDAELALPVGVDVDGSGRVYIVDRVCRVRRVTDGNIETVAGNGTCGIYEGEGGPAASATLSSSFGIAVDQVGTLYITDFLHCAVRRVDTSTGVITTVVGQVSMTTCGFSGDGGLATDAKMSFPRGIELTADGVLYVADSGNCRVRKVEDHIISTVAGGGSPVSCTTPSGDGGQAVDANLGEPIDIALHPDGDLYVLTGSIRRISGGIIDTVAGPYLGGQDGDALPALATRLQAPTSISFDANGNLHVAEYQDGCRIRVIHNGMMYKMAGSGPQPETYPMLTSCGYNGDGLPANLAELNEVYSIEVAGDDLYISDTRNNRVRVTYSLDGDADGVPLGADVCPETADPDQENSDGNFVDNSPHADALDDATWINSDRIGDACDLDDDNDGRTDADEIAGVGCAATDPLLRDTDLDRFLDGPECAIGADPTNPASKPTIAQCAAQVSAATTSSDQDADFIRDHIEYCNYNSNPTEWDSDFDEFANGSTDNIEVASFNGDRSVNSGDQLLLVLEIIREPNPRLRLHNFDINKDGAVNSGDQLLLRKIMIYSGQG